VGVDQRPGGIRRAGRADDERRLVVVGPAVEREDPVALDGARRRRAGAQQRLQALVEIGAGRQGVEQPPGAVVLGLDPRDGVGPRPVLEAAERVGDPDAVQDVDLVAPRGRGWRRDEDLEAAVVGGRSAVVRSRRLSRARRSAWCRGSPSCAGR
jgi:hypothetical protein